MMVFKLFFALSRTDFVFPEAFSMIDLSIKQMTISC